MRRRTDRSCWNTANTVQYNYAQNVTINATGRAVGGLIGKIDTTNHLVSENYANVTMNGTLGIYAGSFAGFRTSGNFANNFAKPVSGLHLVGSATAGVAGTTTASRCFPK